MAAVNKLKLWAPPIAWMGGIFWLSSIPGSDLPKLNIPFADKVIHCTEFFVLGALIARAFFKSFPETKVLKAVIITVSIATLYAAFDEWHQRFIPGRTVDILDFTANFIGLNIGILLYSFYERKNRCL